MRDSNIDKCYPLDHSSRRAGSFPAGYLFKRDLHRNILQKINNFSFVK